MSPRPGPVRPIIGVRIRQQDVDQLDQLAKAEGIGRSEMVRRLLAEALAARQQPPA